MQEKAMILPYNYKNQVDSVMMHELIMAHRKSKSKETEDRLFCAFWEICKIIRSYVSARGWKNLNEDDWMDIMIVAITHMFSKVHMYNHRKKNVCFAFCYMILYNKIRDLVKQYSFNKYVYNGLTNIEGVGFMSSISSDKRGYSPMKTNIIPVKRFKNYDQQ